MNMPGFTAEGALEARSRSYAGRRLYGRTSSVSEVVPQTAPGFYDTGLEYCDHNILCHVYVEVNGGAPQIYCYPIASC
jgi:hypothetical protein